jgi:two-component system sensor histidine kinase BarA
MSDNATIDRTALERLLDLGGASFVVEMIDVFCGHTPQLIAAAREGLSRGEIPAVERAAHSLKSSAANLGATELRSLAQETEEQARALDLDGLAERVEQLDSAFGRARALLEKEREGLSP